MEARRRDELKGRRLLRLGTTFAGLGVALCVAGILWLVLRSAPADGWDLPSPWWPQLVALCGALLAAVGLRLRAKGVREARLCPATFFTADEEAQVIEAIGKAEARTSAEIRVHLHDHVSRDVFEAARDTFEQLGMTATQQRNGVLVFVSTRDHKIAILGDAGIDAHVEPGFWDSLVASSGKAFAKGLMAHGLAEAIARVGDRLAEHFPRSPDDANELPDDISRS